VRVQDFLTCAFLMSSKDRFFSRSQFGQLAAAMGDGLDEVRALAVAAAVVVAATVVEGVGCQYAPVRPVHAPARN
jgi:hypothetical protein